MGFLGLGKTPSNNVPWVEAVVEHLRISCVQESCCKTTRGAKPFINPRPYVFGTPGLDFSPVWFRALGLGPWRLVACKALVLRGRRLWFCVHSNLVLNFQSKAQTRRKFSPPQPVQLPQIAFMALSLTPSIAFANMLPGVTVSQLHLGRKSAKPSLSHERMSALHPSPVPVHNIYTVLDDSGPLNPFGS